MGREIDPRRVKANGVIARVFAVVFGLIGVVMFVAGVMDVEWMTITFGAVFLVVAAFLWNVARAAKARLTAT